LAEEEGEGLPEEGGRSAAAEQAGGALGLMFLVGSAALLAAMATDFVGVISRHLHVPLIGAIEIIQAFIVFAIAASGIAVTLTRGHATVHVVTERLPPAWRARLSRVSDVLGFVAFSAIAVGELWLLYDTRDWDERSDLLGLPIWPLRLVWAASRVVVALLFLVSAFRRRGRAGPEAPE
jgi:TRAP-type C4-dicarboxylate transport system permease small subunit